MDMNAYREQLDKYIDVASLSDEQVQSIYEKQQQKHNERLEKQLKHVLRAGKYLHRKQDKKRA